MWGEWYYTDNFGDQGVTSDQRWSDRTAVLNELLNKLDTRIFVLVRYVPIRYRIFGDTVTANSARVGFHNDALLSPDDDYGTFTTFANGTSVDQMRTYMASQTRLPVGGESADYNLPTSDWPNAGNILTPIIGHF